MCKPTITTKTSEAPPALKHSSSSLMSTEAFETQPTFSEMLRHAGPILFFLFAVEYALRGGFIQFKDRHPLLEIDYNREMLARHIGTDALCCWTVAYLGFTSFMEVCPGFVHRMRGQKGALPKAGFESRMFTFRPAAFRLCLFFAIYQIKNMYDTFLWNDGWLFVGHHAMCLFVAYGAIFHGVAHTYAPFFFGISEVSTMVLCLLANFDDDHGVPGLAEAFPNVKVGLGAVFAVCFIGLRGFAWAFMGYYFVTDSLNAINNTDSTRDVARPYIKAQLASFIGLSCLQILWLREIGKVGMVEFEKMGLIGGQ